MQAMALLGSLAFVALVAWFGTVLTVKAHDAPSGWSYDGACCNAMKVHPDGRITGDCAPIPLRSVKVTPKGYQVTLTPQDHALIKETKTWLVPFRDPSIRVSGDWEYHACVGKNTNKLFCLYTPRGGV